MAALAVAHRSWSLSIPSLRSWAALRPWSIPCEPSSSTIPQYSVSSASDLPCDAAPRPWAPIVAGLSSLLELLPPILLAVPKHKVTHSRKSMRSANKGLKNKTNFSNCEACGMIKLAHNICPNCYSQISRRFYPKPIDIYYVFAQSHPKWQNPTEGQLLTKWDAARSQYAPVTISIPDQAKEGEKWRLCLSLRNYEGGWTDSVAKFFETEREDEDADGFMAGGLPYKRSPMIIPVSSEAIEITAGAGPSSGAERSANGEAMTKKMKKEGRTSPKAKQEKTDKVTQGQGAVAKQKRIEREFHWAFDRTSMGTIYVLEQTSFDLDKKLWDSGFALGMWLWKVHHMRELECEELYYEWPEEAKGVVHRLQNEIFWGDGEERTTVLELGSGTGFVSLCFAKIWNDVMPEGRDLYITATDLPSAMGLLNENIKGNSFKSKCTDMESGVRIEDSNVKKGDEGSAPAGKVEEDEEDNDEDEGLFTVDVRARVLDWDEPLPSWTSTKDEGEPAWPDLILASDVTYNTASFPSLVKTLVSLLKPDDRQDRPDLLLAYKERDPAERELWPMLEAEGIKMQKIDRMRGAEDYGEVEIWVGSAGELPSNP